jgi:hypothetical protein
MLLRRSNTNVLFRARIQQRCPAAPCRSRSFREIALAFVLLRDDRVRAMLRRAFAVLLLILTASPFTAPFATCDVTTLFGDDVSAVPQHATIASATEDGSHTVPLCAASSTIRSRIRAVSRTVVDADAPGVTLTPVPHHVDVIALGRSHSPTVVSLRI